MILILDHSGENTVVNVQELTEGFVPGEIFSYVLAQYLPDIEALAIDRSYYSFVKALYF